ncbi:TPA: hypothetical protein LA462_000292 [Clostridium botulinum]|nr:hypothetical protein [Clostridium botulinum]
MGIAFWTTLYFYILLPLGFLLVIIFKIISGIFSKEKKSLKIIFTEIKPTIYIELAILSFYIMLYVVTKYSDIIYKSM